ncbi:MAG: phasin family protein [Planctomycetes bacterium]|nr:phasin family protein [Planctomycetota bacterium]
MPEPAASEPLIIKRYPNRKLYDTGAKRYITLDQIEDRVRDGQDVRVIDHETGEDLTTVTLSNILLEQEKKHESSLPRSVLTDIIQRGGRQLVDYARKVVGGWFATEDGGMGVRLEEAVARLVEAGQLGKEQVDALRHALAEQVHVNWEKIEALISARVQAGFARLDLPAPADLRKLTRLVEHLEERMAALEAQGPRASRARKRRGRGAKPNAAANEGRPSGDKQ